MKLFIKNVVLFFLPIFVVLLCVMPFYVALLKSGEFADIKYNIESQRDNHRILFGMGYNEQTASYKLINANYYQADVVALGTSRVMQFKDECFSASFYNCGGAVGGNYNEYKNFLENLSYKPKILLLGLDSWVFNDNWNRNSVEYNEYKKIEEIDRNKMAILKSVLSDWFEGKWTFFSLNNYGQNIGFNGRIRDEGFLYDGSYYYGYIYMDPTGGGGCRTKNALERIALGSSRFEYGEHIDEDTLVQLENLLRYCDENAIYVIGFLPPFAPVVYDTMIESGNYTYLDEIMPACSQLFDKYQFELYDFIDGSTLGVADDFFIDGFHGSDLVYGYILLNMEENGSMIGKEIDKEKIARLLQNAFDSLTFYDPYCR